MNGEPCKCGCGEIASHQAHYLKGHAVRGTKASKERVAKMSAGVAEAWKRGAFLGSIEKRKKTYAKRRKEILASRPLCKCGCGKQVKRAASIYATVKCAPRKKHGAEHMKRMSEARDAQWGAGQSKRMIERMGRLVGTEEYAAMRRENRIARGMPDHLCAKSWIIRDPSGKVYRFSNLSEWVRQNLWRFEDDRPESKTPFERRVYDGIIGLLLANGRKCSSRGWTAVSKLELEDAGRDLLERKPHTGSE